MASASLTHEAGYSVLVLWDNPQGWVGSKVEGGFRMGRAHVHLWLTHVNVWQKPSQYCKVIILQLK